MPTGGALRVARDAIRCVVYAGTWDNSRICADRVKWRLPVVSADERQMRRILRSH